MKLSGHTALVTGGSSGVGLALARELHGRGNRVLICGRDPARLERAAAELPGLETLRCDLADEGELECLVRELGTRAPGLSLLFNNAAVQRNYLVTDAPPEVGREVHLEVATNFTAPLLLSARLLPLLARQPEAALVNFTTGLALAPKKSAVVYCATKAGLRTFTKALRYGVEDAGLKVRVVEAMLPLVDTPMTAGRGDPRRKLSPERTAREIMRGLEGDRTTINVGVVKVFTVLYRLLPGVAERLLRDA